MKQLPPNTAALHSDPPKDLEPSVSKKIEELEHYDILGMDTVVSILSWGRSGSLLLASYFDGHENVILLPELCGQRLYDFFYRHQSLPWREKLLAYPSFLPHETRFFEGEFAISPEEYQAAIQAIGEFYAQWPADFLESRRAFFLFVHIAYTLALGRRPATSRPVIVYQQHNWNDALAGDLVHDFPQSKFIHTIRDPISACDGVFHSHLSMLADRHIALPRMVLDCLINKDRPHPGMESRTRTVRFEDLHRASAQILHDLADWVGFGYHPALLESTFNGLPYVVRRDGVAWSGPRLEKTQRHSVYFSRKDRALMYALLFENFVEWEYPCRKTFKHAAFRYPVFLVLLLAPTKMEMVGARAVMKNRIVPALRRGNWLRVIKSLAAIGYCRVQIIGLLAPAFFRRRLSPAALLEVRPNPGTGEPAETASAELHVGKPQPGTL